VTFLAPPKCRRRSKTGGPDIAASSQKTHQRPSYGLASFALSGFCRTPSETRPHRPQAARALQRYLRARSLAACCAYGSFQGLTAPQSDATNYPPARHRTPGEIISEPRATSSRNARATSSESALNRRLDRNIIGRSKAGTSSGTTPSMRRWNDSGQSLPQMRNKSLPSSCYENPPHKRGLFL